MTDKYTITTYPFPHTDTVKDPVTNPLLPFPIVPQLHIKPNNNFETTILPNVRAVEFVPKVRPTSPTPFTRIPAITTPHIPAITTPHKTNVNIPVIAPIPKPNVIAPIIPKPNVIAPIIHKPNVIAPIPKPTVVPIPKPNVIAPIIPKPTVVPIIPIPKPNIIPIIPKPTIIAPIPKPTVVPIIPKPTVVPIIPIPKPTPVTYNFNSIYNYTTSELDSYIANYTNEKIQDIHDKRYFVIKQLIDDNYFDLNDLNLIVNAGAHKFSQILKKVNNAEELRSELNKPTESSKFTFEMIYDYNQDELDNFITSHTKDKITNLADKRYFVINTLLHNNYLDDTDADIITQVGKDKFIKVLHQSNTVEQLREGLFKSDEKGEDGECCICADPVPISDILNCGHFVCRVCLPELPQLQCPICQKNLEGPTVTIDVVDNINNNINKNKINKTQLDTWLLKIQHEILNNTNIRFRDDLTTDELEYIDDLIALESQGKLSENLKVTLRKLKYWYPNQWYNLTDDQYKHLYDFIKNNKYIPEYSSIVK
jgi:putative SOS response-associated peptidase YedK